MSSKATQEPNLNFGGTRFTETNRKVFYKSGKREIFGKTLPKKFEMKYLVETMK